MQLLVVELNNGHYGFLMSQILEITTKVKITRIPNSKQFIQGIANLRGKIVPMINLKKLLGFEERESDTGCYVFFRIENSGNLLVGTKVDAISQTITVDEKKLRDVPSFEDQVDCRFVRALYPENGYCKPIAIINLVEALRFTENENENNQIRL
ncbi:MAG: chemotaxis protein CheW [Deltaproteobacteria bacterium]|nr:chemotaxis protein CheW [Deltaproteobacteria bacterium]